MTADPRGIFASYPYVDTIGSGAGGAVNLVTYRGTGKNEVMKIIIIGADISKAQKAKEEVTMMRMCAHEYVVKVLDFFVEKQKFCIVFEYANAGDMQDEIDRRKISKQMFTETEILTYFTQVCLALRRVHSAKLLHRDIKPANVFLTENHG